MIISTRDRVRGCFAGLAIGDALGRPVEGMSAAEIQQRYGRIDGYLQWPPAGSDDTEYALLTAKTLHRVGRGATSADFAQSWIEDVLPQSEGFSGAGFSEAATIDNLRRGIMPPLSGEHFHAWSDGLAMRVAPIGLLAAGDTKAAIRLTQADGEVSHSDEGILGGVAVAVAVSAAMAGADAAEAYDQALAAVPSDSWTARNLQRGREIVQQIQDPRELALALYDAIAVTDFYWEDLAPEAVTLAMAATLVGDRSFPDSVLFAVNLGRDADTIAAIAGCITGAIVGIDGIPSDWVDALRPVEGSCIRSMAGTHPLHAADDLAKLLESTR